MIRTNYSITVTAVLDLNESEMRALDGLSRYNVDAFLEMFYNKMGKHYLSPHEHGLRTLFKKIREQIIPALAACDKAREAAKP